MLQVTSLNYFELLGIEPEADLDLDELERSYLRKSREAHPDRKRADSENELALQSSLNEAWRVLANPWTRFAYLVELREPGLMDGCKKLDSSFLMEAMEAHEEAIGTLEHDDKRAELQRATQAEIDGIQTQIVELLERVDDTPTSHEALTRVATLLHQVRYAQRRLEALSGAEREI